MINTTSVVYVVSWSYYKETQMHEKSQQNDNTLANADMEHTLPLKRSLEILLIVRTISVIWDVLN